MSPKSSIMVLLCYVMDNKLCWRFNSNNYCFCGKYTHDKNVTEIFQLEEELFQLRQGDLELSSYYVAYIGNRGVSSYENVL